MKLFICVMQVPGFTLRHQIDFVVAETQQQAIDRMTAGTNWHMVQCAEISRDTFLQIAAQLGRRW